MTRMKLAVSKDENGHGLLHKAVFHGHRDIVEWLIEKYPETLDMRDWVSQGQVCLHPLYQYNLMQPTASYIIGVHGELGWSVTSREVRKRNSFSLVLVVRK